MKRLWFAAAAVALTVALVRLGVGTNHDVGPGPAAAQAAHDDEGAEGDTRSDRGRQAAVGHGPPPWAQGPAGHAAGDKRAWHSGWIAMSPREREQTMERLAQEHASGMRSWAQCVADGRDDCEKPMPPGLAKKQLRP
jgi:hypothetical protein